MWRHGGWGSKIEAFGNQSPNVGEHGERLASSWCCATAVSGRRSLVGKVQCLMNNFVTPIQNCLGEDGFMMPPNNSVLPEKFDHFMRWTFDS